MTEIPEHLRKRADEARRRAAAEMAGGSTEPYPGESKIPQHLLERARVARERTDAGLPPVPTTEEPRRSVPRRLADAGRSLVESIIGALKDVFAWIADSGPLIACAVIFLLLLLGAIGLATSDPEDPAPSKGEDCTTDVIQQGEQTVTIRTCVS